MSYKSIRCRVAISITPRNYYDDNLTVCYSEVLFDEKIQGCNYDSILWT